MTRTIWNVLIGIDQTGNAALGGNPDETISSRVGKAAERGVRRAVILEAIINLIFAVAAGERHHCADSIERDEA